MIEADRVLATRAERQLGVFSRGEARDAGLTDAQIDWRVASGRWEPVQPRVYRVAGAPLSWWALLRAATCASDRLIAVSHRSATRALELGADPGPEPIELTTPWAMGPLDLRGVVVHRSRTLQPRDVRNQWGIPVTTPERTIIDMAARLSLSGRIALVDDAVCARKVSRPRLHARARELRSGRAGVGSIAAVTAPGARQDFRSYLERHAGRAIRGSDLPRPRWNAPIHRAGRLLGVLDAFWEDARVAAEFDGLRFHLPPARRAKDVARDRRLLLEAGITVLRFTYTEVMQSPEAMVTQIRRALDRAAA